MFFLLCGVERRRKKAGRPHAKSSESQLKVMLQSCSISLLWCLPVVSPVRTREHCQIFPVAQYLLFCAQRQSTDTTPLYLNYHLLTLCDLFLPYHRSHRTFSAFASERQVINTNHSLGFALSSHKQGEGK